MHKDITIQIKVCWHNGVTLLVEACLLLSALVFVLHTSANLHSVIYVLP